MDPTQDPKGFVSILFDLSFKEYVTTKILKFIYILAIIFAVISALGFIGAGFTRGTTAGMLCLIFSPVILLIYIIGARVWVEMIIVLFRISQDLSTLVTIQGGSPAESSTPDGSSPSSSTAQATLPDTASDETDQAG